MLEVVNLWGENNQPRKTKSKALNVVSQSAVAEIKILEITLTTP